MTDIPAGAVLASKRKIVEFTCQYKPCSKRGKGIRIRKYCDQVCTQAAYRERKLAEKSYLKNSSVTH